MLNEKRVAREKGCRTLFYNVAMQSSKVGRHFPEELLKPEPASEHAHQRQHPEAAFSQHNRSVDLLGGLYAAALCNDLVLWRRGRCLHTKAVPFLRAIQPSKNPCCE